MSISSTVRLTLAGALAAAVVASGALAGGSKGPDPVPKTTPVIVRTATGFDWGDAAIGAGAGVGATLAAAGVITLARHQ